MDGIVRWFNSRKGYGFITPGVTELPEDENNENDIFVHFSSIQSDGFKTLFQGELVAFDVEDSDKGKEARNVRVTKESERRKRRGRRGE